MVKKLNNLMTCATLSDGDVNVLDDILSLESAAYLDPEPEEKKKKGRPGEETRGMRDDVM